MPPLESRRVRSAVNAKRRLLVVSARPAPAILRGVRSSFLLTAASEITMVLPATTFSKRAGRKPVPSFMSY